MATPVNPKCLAIIVCESVVEDIQTHNKCIWSTFNQIAAPAFPAQHPKLVVFVTLTNGHGTVPFVLRFAQDTASKVLLELKGSIPFRNPLDIADMVFNLLLLPLPAPGPYSVQILTNGAVIGERRIQVVQASVPGPGGPQPIGGQP